MKKSGVEFPSTGVVLQASPIKDDWIISGGPKAKSAIVSSSADGQCCVVIWECTAGKFRWHYDFDETLYFLEGSVTIDDGNGPRTVGAGDVVYFPKGSSAVWHVETYIRKLAICRKVDPAPIASAIKLLRALAVRLQRSKDGVPLAGAAPRHDPEIVGVTAAE